MSVVRNRFSARNPVVVNTGVLPDRAKQSMKDQANINFIMGKYARGGSIDHLAKHGARYGDFEPQTFQEAMNVVRKSEEMFDDLPAKIRKRFHNSPAEFLEFVQATHEVDGAPVLTNLEEMRKMGLAKPPAEPVAVPRVELGSETIAALRPSEPA